MVQRDHLVEDPEIEEGLEPARRSMVEELEQPNCLEVWAAVEEVVA